VSGFPTIIEQGQAHRDGPEMLPEEVKHTRFASGVPFRPERQHAWARRRTCDALSQTGAARLAVIGHRGPICKRLTAGGLRPTAASQQRRSPGDSGQGVAQMERMAARRCTVPPAALAVTRVPP
jgi:hypothetical protein